MIDSLSRCGGQQPTFQAKAIILLIQNAVSHIKQAGCEHADCSLVIHQTDVTVYSFVCSRVVSWPRSATRQNL